ncbi:MAG: hypothetical protein ABL921_03480 [Pirellula sp.]
MSNTYSTHLPTPPVLPRSNKNRNRLLAIEHSGRCSGLSWITRGLFQGLIGLESHTVPTFRSDNLVLHAEWTRPNSEARVVALLDHPILNEQSLYMLWFIRNIHSKAGMRFVVDRYLVHELE